MQTSVTILCNNTSPHENTYVCETTIAILCTMFLHLHYILHYTRTLIMAKDNVFNKQMMAYIQISGINRGKCVQKWHDIY